MRKVAVFWGFFLCRSGWDRECCNEELANIYSDSKLGKNVERMWKSGASAMIFPGAADTQKKGKREKLFSYTHFPCWHKRERKLNEPFVEFYALAVGCDEAGKSLFSFCFALSARQQCCACEKIIFISLLNIIGIAKQIRRPRLVSPSHQLFVYISPPPQGLFWLEYHGVGLRIEFWFGKNFACWFIAFWGRKNFKRRT